VIKKILISLSTTILIAAVGVGLYYTLRPQKARSYFGYGPIAEVQELMSDIPTLREYSERDPETLRSSGLNAAELKESLKTKETLLQQSIKKLLSRGEDVSQLLGTAYIYRHYDVIDLLLKSGVDINTPYKDGGATVLHMAAFKGDLDMLNSLIEHGADVNAIDYGGIPVLQFAVTGGAETVALLIKHGADVTKNNTTLLHFAVLMNKENIVRLFLQHGASVHTIDTLGRTPLYWTTYAFIGDQGLEHEDRVKIAELLIAHNASITVRDNYDETPLHAAALWGSDAIASLLIRDGADIEAQDKRGFTPLFMAALGSGKIKSNTFGLLRTHNANINHTTKDGVTVLHVATRPDVAQAALDKEININVQDSEGLTPLDYASGFDRNLLYSISYLGVIPYNLFKNDEIVSFLKEVGARMKP
jgi:ankyrin repeat protein